MKTSDALAQKLGIKAGLLIFAALVAYFLLMVYIGYIRIVELRGLNFFILMAGLIATYKIYRANTKPNIDYLQGVALGGYTLVASILPFTLFVYSYFTWINPALMQQLGNRIFLGAEITAGTAALSILVEGICSGVIIAFIIMQYYKAGFRKTRGETRG